MYRVWTIVFLSVFLFGASACGGADTTTDVVDDNSAPATAMEDPSAPSAVGDAANGKELFASTCAACHGPVGEGVEGLGKDMTTSAFIAGLSDDDLMAFVKQGRPPGHPDNTTGVDMPPKGGNPALSDEELVDIIAFMRSIHK